MAGSRSVQHTLHSGRANAPAWARLFFPVALLVAVINLWHAVHPEARGVGAHTATRHRVVTPPQAQQHNRGVGDERQASVHSNASSSAPSKRRQQRRRDTDPPSPLPADPFAETRPGPTSVILAVGGVPVFGNGTRAVDALEAELAQVFSFVEVPSRTDRVSLDAHEASHHAVAVVSLPATDVVGLACDAKLKDDGWRVLFVFTQVGKEFDDIAAVERRLWACRSRVRVLWHRPASDGRRVSAPTKAPLCDLETKDPAEIAAQLALVSPEAALSPVLTRTRQPTVTRWGTMGEIERWHVRTLYDPDHFAIHCNPDDPSVDECTIVLDTSRVVAVDSPEAFDDLTPDDSAPKKRRRLGNRARPRIGVVTEGGFTNWSPVAHSRRAPECAEHRVVVARGEVAAFHYPWVRDNVYHTHNDNLLPLQLALGLIEGHHGAIEKSRHLIVLPSMRSQKPLPVFATLAPMLFQGSVLTLTSARAKQGGEDKRSSSASDASSNETATCVSVRLLRGARALWGRPPRLFSAEATKVYPYRALGVVAGFLRTLTRQEGGFFDCAKGGWHPRRRVGTSAIRVVWLHRGGKRRLENERMLIEALQTGAGNRSADTSPVELKQCCDGLDYSEQLALMAGADVLIGVHGAGLLHILHLGVGNCRWRSDDGGSDGELSFRTPLVVHVGSRRLNYHEQVVIERLALLRRGEIRFHTTRTFTSPSDSDAAWQNSFSLPRVELRQIADDVKAQYLTGV